MQIEVGLVVLIALFFSGAFYLLLAPQLIRIILGVTILGNAVNLLIFTAGRLTREVPPIIPEGFTLPQEATANPLPQALVLTAIVISFSFFVFLFVLVMRSYQELGTDESGEMRISEPESVPLPPLDY